MKKLKYKKIISAILILTTLSGCATTIPMSEQNKKYVHTVALNNNIKVPEDFYYYGPETTAGLLLGGGLGASAGSALGKNKDGSIQSIALKNDIKIDQIFRTEFTKQLSQNPNIKLVKNQKSDAEIQLDIKVYGVSIPNGFSSHFDPFIVVEAKMIKDNKVIWQQNEGTNLLLDKGIPEYTYAEIKQNPKRLEEMWRYSANDLSKKLISNFAAKS